MHVLVNWILLNREICDMLTTNNTFSEFKNCKTPSEFLLGLQFPLKANYDS